MRVATLVKNIYDMLLLYNFPLCNPKMALYFPPIQIVPSKIGYFTILTNPKTLCRWFSNLGLCLVFTCSVIKKNL